MWEKTRSAECKTPLRSGGGPPAHREILRHQRDPQFHPLHDLPVNLFPSWPAHRTAAPAEQHPSADSSSRRNRPRARQHSAARRNHLENCLHASVSVSGGESCPIGRCPATRIDQNLLHQTRSTNKALPFTLPRHEAPVAAVLRVVAIVSHHEVVPFGHRHRAVGAPDVERSFTRVAAGGINWKQRET